MGYTALMAESEEKGLGASAISREISCWISNTSGRFRPSAELLAPPWVFRSFRKGCSPARAGKEFHLPAPTQGF